MEVLSEGAIVAVGGPLGDGRSPPSTVWQLSQCPAIRIIDGGAPEVGMDEFDRRRLKAEARIRLTEEIVGHLQLRRGQARMSGDEGALWAFERWLALFDGFLIEERGRLADLPPPA